MKIYEHGGQIYDSDGKTGDWLDFSANINPLGLSEKILQALTENLRGVMNYPDPNATELKRAISNRYGVAEKNLVVLNGAAEFFYLYLNANSRAELFRIRTGGAGGSMRSQIFFHGGARKFRDKYRKAPRRFKFGRRCDNRATEQPDGQFNIDGRNFAAGGGCQRPNRRILYRFFGNGLGAANHFGKNICRAVADENFCNTGLALGLCGRRRKFGGAIKLVKGRVERKFFGAKSRRRGSCRRRFFKKNSCLVKN